MSLISVASEVSQKLEARKKREEYKKDPVAWAKDVVGVHLWSAQRDVAMSVALNQNTAVKAGHGTGKSFLAALLICWWVDTRYPDCFVASTAPSQAQIGAIVWREVENIASKVSERYKEGLIDHDLPGYRTHGAYPEWKTDTGVVIGFGRKPVDRVGSTGDSMQGIHAMGGVLAIGDEAVGLSEELIDALGNITSTDNSRRLLICNPTNPMSYVAKLFKSKPDNWDFRTISVLSNPNFTDEKYETPPDVLQALSDESFVEQKRAEYGEGSAQWVSRIEGEFAWDMGFTLFQPADLEKAYDVEVVPSENVLPVLGVDVSRSKAGDQNTVYKYHDGLLRFVDAWNEPNAVRTAERVYELALEHGVSEVRIDGAGLGGPIADQVREFAGGRFEVIEILGNNASPDVNRWYNFRAWAFWDFQDRMSRGLIDVDVLDEDLSEQLLGLEIKKRESGRDNLLLASKEEIRKKGGRSPDHADAANYAALDLEPWTGNPYNAVPVGTMFMASREDVFEFDSGLSLVGPGIPIL